MHPLVRILLLWKSPTLLVISKSIWSYNLHFYNSLNQIHCFLANEIDSFKMFILWLWYSRQVTHNYFILYLFVQNVLKWKYNVHNTQVNSKLHNRKQRTWKFTEWHSITVNVYISEWYCSSWMSSADLKSSCQKVVVLLRAQRLQSARPHSGHSWWTDW